MHYTVIMSQVGCETCFMFKEFYCVIFFVSESDFSMYGMMFLSFQPHICVLNIFYPNMLKCFSFSIMTFPEQCVCSCSINSLLLSSVTVHQKHLPCGFIPDQVLGSFAKLRKVTLASSWLAACLSVHMEQFCSQLTDFHEIWYLSTFFENLLRKLKCH